MRSAIFRSNATSELREAGLRLFDPGWLVTEAYIRAMALTRVWLATTEVGLHVGTRFFEVMISGRALLLCDRNPTAYEPLGIIEGVHAAMFNTTAEFQRKVLHYARRANDGERMRMVRAARELMIERHLWDRRASEFAGLVRDALAARARTRRFAMNHSLDVASLSYARVKYV